MSRAPIDIGRLPEELAKRERAIKEGILRGIRNGVRRGRAMLVLRTPKDMGLAKASWYDSSVGGPSTGTVAEIWNSAPYAGILEEGARPHGVSAEGRLAIYEWARRHFPDEDDAGLKRITHAICHKLATRGQRPTYFVREARPALVEAAVEEIIRSVQKISDQPRAP